MHYSFANPATGRSEPKASYLIALDWDGTAALIGAGIYQPDIPATCYPEQVNATQLDATPDDLLLAQFVRCAATVIGEKGFFGVAELMTERWRNGSVYVFGVDARSGVQLFTSSPATVDGRQMMEGLDDRDPTGRFAGRDAPAVGAAFGEAYLYYDSFNPGTGRAQAKVSFVKRVTVQGAPVLVGAGSYPGAAASGAGAAFGAALPSLDRFNPAMRQAKAEAALVKRAVPPVTPAPAPAQVKSWTNTLGAEFVWVPPGTFQMGSPGTEVSRRSDEVQHAVTLSAGYWMGKHEVTRADWAAVMGTNPSSSPACGPRCPVDKVSYADAQEFVRKLNVRWMGLSCRTPPPPRLCHGGAPCFLLEGSGRSPAGGLPWEERPDSTLGCCFSV